MRNVFLFGIAFIALSSCGAKDPLSGLSESQKLFMFGDDESKITFMGWPSNGQKVSCNPSIMSQGYAFIIDEKSLFIESIRPSGTERHKISDIVSSNGNIDVKAKNGANLPFSLKFTNFAENSVSISFDGEANSEFRRCVR